MKIGQRIKRYRVINDIRQEDMAEKLGISRATLINYEKGHTAINVDVLEKIKNEYSDFDYFTESKLKDNVKPRIIDENNINFNILFRALLENKKSIIFSTFLITILGTSFSFLFTKYYSAQISLYPAKKESMQGLGQFQSLASNFGMKMPENNQDFNIPDVVKSRLIANKVLDQLWETKNGKKISLFNLWKLNKNYSSFINESNDSTFIREKAVKIFLEHINVQEDRITGLITIIVTLEDPRIAASIANFIGEQVQRYIQKENSAQSKREKLFINERLNIVKNELETNEMDLKIFKERNRKYQDSPELFMVFSRIFREVEAKKNVYLTLQQQLELARIEEVKQSPILHILDHAIPPSRKSSPRRLFFLFFSLAIGFLSSSLSVVFKY